MDFDIQNAATEIANSVDGADKMAGIREAIEGNPDGAFLFVITEGPMDAADSLHILSNVDIMGGLALAETYKYIVLNNTWGQQGDEEEAEEEA